MSEETGLEGEAATSHRGDVADTESWEQLGSELGGYSRDSRAKLSEMGEEEEGVGGQKEQCQAFLQSIELLTGSKEMQKNGEEKNGDDVDSNSSDWEKWDD